MMFLACTCIDFHVKTQSKRKYVASGLSTGFIFYTRVTLDERGPAFRPHERLISKKVHTPEIGDYPRFASAGPSTLSVILPLWPPLSAVLGWLVIRELRWREKRAKVAEN